MSTEMYTHITTKGFDQIKSPLDNLDVEFVLKIKCYICIENNYKFA